jgi:Fe-S-cluster containining protein
MKVEDRITGSGRISADDVKEAVRCFVDIDASSSLSDIYARIPSGDCSGCAACCIESVNTSFAEFINILMFMGRLDEETKAGIVRRSIGFYENELSTPMDCPFLSDGKRCLIHEVRPLECRMFGSMEKDGYESDYESVLKENMESSRAFEEYYGFPLPEDVVRRKLPHCEKYRPQRRVAKEEKSDLINELMAIDMKLVESGGASYDNLGSSLVHLMGRIAFSESSGEALRVESVRRRAGRI